MMKLNESFPSEKAVPTKYDSFKFWTVSTPIRNPFATTEGFSPIPSDCA
jgi:hypothetical protein